VGPVPLQWNIVLGSHEDRNVTARGSMPPHDADCRQLYGSITPSSLDPVKTIDLEDFALVSIDRIKATCTGFRKLCLSLASASVFLGHRWRSKAAWLGRQPLYLDERDL